MHNGTGADLATQVGFSVSTLNTTPKNYVPDGRSYKLLASLSPTQITEI